jgi:FlaA1/EpsC-like NDP-sugar epimerase
LAVRRARSLTVGYSFRARGDAGPLPLEVHGGTRLTRSIAGLRGRHLLVLDLFGIIVGGYLALALRFDHLVDPLSLPAMLPAFAILIAVRSFMNIRLGLYSRHWRFASIPDLERITLATLLGSTVSVLLFYSASALLNGHWEDGFPRSFWFAELLVSLLFVGGARFGIRAAWDRRGQRGPRARMDRHATLLYGAGQSGALVARSAQRGLTSSVHPVGFLDDDPSLSGRVVAGLPVFGDVSALADAVESTGATTLLITMPSAPGKAIRRVVDAALAAGLEVRTVPPISDLVDGSMVADRIRQVRVEDLLRRPIVSDHAPLVRDIIEGKTILITGAGGSIGSELARQAFAIGPRRLVLVDRSESALFEIHRELETRRLRGRGNVEIAIHLANVASRGAMTRLIATESPGVIFHAAAYKHVPMMESHPSDAAHVNVGGTMALLDAAEAAGVERFVFVSTDKAVKPSSVMGASKRVGEMLVADTARRTGRPYVSVRFGNVLGSTSSVVPIFQEQLEKGEPLTITHPDMTRFFMTIPEAAWLILDAAALGESGDLFVLDMGDAVRVVDLARDLVRLSGRDPDSHPFEIIGLRPGEKLHEELFYAGETVRPTASSKVLRVAAGGPAADIREQARGIIELATGDDEPAVAQALRAAVLPPDRRAGEASEPEIRVMSIPAAVALSPSLDVAAVSVVTAGG